MGGASLYRQAIMGNTTPALLPPPPPRSAMLKAYCLVKNTERLANSLVVEGEVAVVRI